MTMKMRLRKKNASHKYDIKYDLDGHEYTKCKMCLDIMMIVCSINDIMMIVCSIKAITAKVLYFSPAFKILA